MTKAELQEEQSVYMWTDDRVEQCNWLREVASDIVSYSGAESPEQAKEAVDMWLKQDGFVDDIPLPKWFDGHDRQLLVEWVGESL